jgi:hypothetical protein
MPSCVLRISGCDFDVDRFLAESSLIPVAVYRKGDRRRPASRGISSMSGFNVDIGGADDDIADQSAAAIRFISANRQELERAHTDPGVEDLVLDFATQFRDVAVQGESFPADLVAAAGSVGASIAITLYPPSKD